MDGRCDIGIVGLGVMGRNLLLNMADHGFAVAGHDRDFAKVEALRGEPAAARGRGTASPEEFIGLLRRPRAALMLVPAGPPVDSVIRTLLPHLEPGDILLDGGNSHFADTDLRSKAVGERGISYLGVGISGGEHGARRGASIMPGGPRAAYERVRPMLEAVAAVPEDGGAMAPAGADGEKCIAWLGPGSAGHYVKMVHNGIEYALMELIAESYDLLRRGAGLGNEELAAAFEGWSRGGLHAYLLDIAADIFRRRDEKTARPLIDLILDEARQKGTGMWTSEDALELRVPAPTVDAAVSARDLSALKAEREAAARLYRRPALAWRRPGEGAVADLGTAFRTAATIAFAQGLALLGRASAARGYGLSLAEVARIWRGGCIIRTALLDPIRAAFRARPDLPNLLLDPALSREVRAGEGRLRVAVGGAVRARIPAPALASALAYLDGFRSGWLPANLIQAQRDYFGAHTYERIDDRKGVFHTEWRHPVEEEERQAEGAVAP